MTNKEYILDTTKTLMQTLANIGVEVEDDDLTFDVIENHITEVVKKLSIAPVMPALREKKRPPFGCPSSL